MELRHYSVFLSSPAEMAHERSQVTGFIANWNRSVGRHWGVCLDAIQWETDSTAGMGRPQGVLTRDLLDAHRSNMILFLAIVGSQYGSPTGTHDSGTEEEIEWALGQHRSTGAPEVKVYFHRSPTIDVGYSEKSMEAQLRSLQRVLSLRARLIDRQEALVLEFRDRFAFYEMIERDLMNWLGQSSREWHGSDAGEDQVARQLAYAQLSGRATMDALTSSAAPDAESRLSAAARCLPLLAPLATSSRTGRVEAISSARVLDIEAPLMLAGGVRSGKSVVVRELFRALRATRGAVPVLVDFRDFVCPPDSGPSADALVRVVEGTIARGASVDCESVSLRGLIESSRHRVVVLGENWSRLVGDSYLWAHAALADFRKTFPSVRVVLVTEGAPYAARAVLPGVEVAHLLPADWRHKGMDARIGSIERNEVSGALGDTPAMLALSLPGDTPARAETGRLDALDGAISDLIRANDRTGGDGLAQESVERAAVAIWSTAFPISEDGWTSATVQIGAEHGKRLRSERVTGAFRSYCAPEEVRFFSDDLGALERRDDGGYRVLEPVVFERLCMRYLVRSGEEPASFICRAARHSCWRRVALFLALEQPEAGRRSVDRLIQELVAEESPKYSERVFDELGWLFAHGVGSDSSFERWRSIAARRGGAGRFGLRHAHASHTAWRTTNELHRRDRLTMSFRDLAVEGNWLRQLSRDEWAVSARVLPASPSPAAYEPTPRLIGAALGELRSLEDVAIGRVCGGASPFWPWRVPKLVLLRLVPSRRRVVSAMLQVIASLGGTRAELGAAMSHLCDPDRLLATANVRDLADRLSLSNDPEAGYHLGGWEPSNWDRTSAPWRVTLWEIASLAHQVGLSSVRLASPRAWASLSALERGHDVPREWLRICAGRGRAGLLPTSIPARMSGYVSTTVRAAAGASIEDVLPRTSSVLLGECWGFVGPRSLLHTADRPPALAPDLWSQAIAACDAYLGDRSWTPRLPVDADPRNPCEFGAEFWRALFSAVAGSPSHADLDALGVEVARLAERDTLAGWGVRTIVRGDVVLLDGGVVTLDELASACSVPRLPLVDIDFPGRPPG